MIGDIIVGIVIGFVVCRFIDLYYYEGLRINPKIVHWFGLDGRV